MEKSEIKTKWLEELRSGEHKQIPGALKGECENNTVGFCCLGVLEEKVLGGNVRTSLWSDGNYDTEGEPEVYEKLRDLLGQTMVNTLTRVNDEGCPFPEIADWIEEKWKVD